MDGYERAHRKALAASQKRIQAILDKYEKEIARLAGTVSTNPGEPFRFKDHPSIKARYERLIKDMEAEIETSVTEGVKAEWGRADGKNDALAVSVVGSAEKASAMGYISRNTNALEAFLTRKRGGMTLSDRVWQYTGQYSTQIQDAIGIAVSDGTSATELSREVRQYLQHPDTLFRRVRDEYGVLHLSKNASAYHPGTGVYRSAYMNARRMAVTEINMAYRTSDYMRVQQLDFVVGIEVHLSGNHNCKGIPPGQFFDICDELQGKYPKTFKFTGWHPHCRCYTTTVLKSREEMREDAKRIKEGKDPSKPENSPQAVTTLPDNFTKWLADNQQRVATAKRLPYFLKDNGQRNADGVWEPFIKALPPAKAAVQLPVAAEAKDYTLKAKTIAEAEAEIASRLGVTCSLKGFKNKDLQQVQDIFASAGENMDRFPELRDKIKFVGTMQGRREVYENALFEKYKALYPAFKEEYVREYAKQTAKKHMKIKSNVYAISASGYAVEEVNGVAFNATWRGDKVIKQLESDVKHKFHPDGCGTVKAVFDHELGHIIDEALGLQSNAEFMTLYIEARLKGVDFIRDNLSGYADTNRAEFIAECWSEYLNNPNPREIAKKVGELIERLIAQKKAP